MNIKEAIKLLRIESPDDDIKKLFNIIVKETHPDLHGDNPFLIQKLKNAKIARDYLLENQDELDSYFHNLNSFNNNLFSNSLEYIVEERLKYIKEVLNGN